MRFFHLFCTVLLAAALATACAHDTSVDGRVAGAGRLAQEAEDHLKAANDLIKADRDLDDADAHLAKAKEITQESAMLYFVDRENLEDRLSQAGTRLAAARDARHRREIAAKVPERKEKATALLAEFRAAADLLQDRAALDRKRTTRAREALDEAARFLADSKEFEIDASWASFSATARKDLGGRTALVVLAEALMAFYDGPVALNARAKKLFDESKAAKGEERTALLTQARDAWLACGKDAGTLFGATPLLEREPLQVPGVKSTAKSFAAACDAQAKSAEGLLKAPAKPGPAAKPPAKAPAKPAKPPTKKK